MTEFLDSIVEWSGAREDWRPISRAAILGWLVFFCLFLIYAFRMHGDYLFIDSANLVVHEGAGLAPPSASGEEPFCNGWFHCCSLPTSSANASPQPLRSAYFSSSKTGSTPRPIWPTLAPWFCRS